ncbi:tRNA (adenosine(37)-N6)-threonylcarbamoyltransferase complex transferase subunit TsaD [Thermosynechococcaceae cyanobacterium BACA0444]|uniref:tRNA N6-adenosine threonylcarbamoyltransferase n=1 Tax=Pseudocalidococcus azoricus BACA0444 TaxID=2918990 RepID=A0AAE4FPZ6_9CYAN|nr:tRNA (adenosine(37)-N6)-threonylcarbamoyltransferase complex transferase subunit TsaD [Pseudocalidococcus azoricus]MDS3860148.1 tRNA (adenosine(37)-N6)-threonylcarbamoyltransferase complex transferase subunit TsaD [Pseudocalidococcus azoricus BACA0444]
MAIILGIETSCDETAAAVVNNRYILSNVVASQVLAHQPYGGVVPEVASRCHLETINLVIEEALNKAGLTWAELDGIGVTCAPGLVGSLLIGVMAAKTLALVHHKPLIGVHHLEGHIYASYLANPGLEPPFLCLLVSGGHTSLIHVQACGKYEILGQTRDDAAGEAFDKVARLLQLGYPGGPAMDRAAKEGNPHAFVLPEGNVSTPEGKIHPYDTSFSGLKTAMARLITKLQADKGSLPTADLAASFQATVARALTKRVIKAALDRGLGHIVIGGGVAANSELRRQLMAATTAHGLDVTFPPLALCTDNAAMIAAAGAEHYQNNQVSGVNLATHSRLALTQVNSLYSASRSG